uniref:Phosphatidylglycerophosphatase A n=1 Tax=candidate division WOR-3 bacterium TaxID=2052148 RepID=A0A7C4XKU4_UNCW3
MRFLKILFITGLGLGYLPIAPATFSCLLSIVLWYLFKEFPLIYFAVFINLFLWGMIVSKEFLKEWGKDPSRIVIDEFSSFLIPLYFTPKKILPLIATFIVFRLFDIIKPFPLRKLEKLPDVWGVMIDDLGAALLTTIVVLLLKLSFRTGI